MTLATGNRAWAGPPFVTDDPEPVEYKHWEVYLFGTYNHTAGTDAAQAPAIEVNYGAVPEVQLHLVAPFAYNRAPGDGAHSGYGDTELGIKYRFFQETDYLPQIGVFPLVELPTGDANRGLGNGKTQVFAPVWLQKNFGKDKEWTTFGGGGFWYNPGPDRRNYFRFGWEVQREFGEHLTLGGEIYHETPSAGVGQPTGVGTPTVIGSQGHTGFNLGGYLNLNEHNHILFTFGRDIQGLNRFSCYLGYQLTF